MAIDNNEIADALERVADLLEAQHADGFRVRAYRRAAQTCRALPRPLGVILASEGQKGLERLPAVGKSIAATVAEYLVTGRLRLLDRLEGEVSPEALFATLPGVGEELARRIHADLGVETLEDLEVAAHDGRLAEVPGIGERRVRAIRDSVAAVLGPSSRRRARRLRAADRPPERPAAATILAVDAEYRRRAAAGTLRRIAPRRFNPSGEAWLPILHETRDGWYFTALFSNTARAHQFGATRDWVVVFYERDGMEGQHTVVTEHAGPRAGQRVVRGRESETPRSPGNPALPDAAAAAR
ncbi:MAG TPA: helix-hairpin-helix domain-containing protein [Planctomycetota bacterium]|nr:helix-hairpin-helix domain-containing protein [Planctomycetota bacterium]